MPKPKNRTLIKILIILPYLLVLYILQAMVFTHVTLWGVKPLIMPLAVVGVALFHGRVTGGVFGIFAGMLMDLAYNQATIQFTLLLTFTGLLFGILSDTVLAQGFPSFLLCAVAQLTICSAFQVLSMVFLRGIGFSALLGTAIAQCLYSLLFAIPTYYFSRFLNRII